MSSVDQALRIAKELRPDFYERTEAVAKIIDPPVFAGKWISSDPDHQKLVDTRQRHMQAVALSKAHEVLAYLGVNADTDWYEILTRMAKEGPA